MYFWWDNALVHITKKSNADYTAYFQWLCRRL